jgi:uncharacterized ferredoxin-like protein
MKKLLNKLFIKTRYFIVFFTAAKKNENGHVVGEVPLSIIGKKPFLNRKQVCDYIKEQNKEISNIIITGFIEVKKHEYKKWGETL